MVDACGSNREKYLVAFVFIAMAVLYLWHSWSDVIDHDEIEHLHASWLMLGGAKPYVDFFEHHSSLYWYILFPIVGVFKEPISAVFAGRLLNIAFIAIMIYFFVRLSRRICPGTSPWWGVMLLLASFMFFSKGVEVRPDPLMNLLCFMGICLWIEYLFDKRIAQAFSAGLSFGLAVVLLQKAIVIFGLVGMSIVALLVINWRDRARLKAIFLGGLAVLAGSLVVEGIYIFWIWRQGILDEYIFWNYTFNNFLFFEAKLTGSVPALRTIGRSFAQTPGLWLMGVFGVVMAVAGMIKARRLWSARNDAFFVLAFVLLGYIASVFRSRFVWAQYLLIVFVLLAVLSVELLAKARSRWPTVMKVLALIMAVEFAIILSFRQSNAPQRAVHDYLLKNTGAGEKIAVPPPLHPIFRHDTPYFWFNNGMMYEALVQYCAKNHCERELVDVEKKRWKEAPPKYVIQVPGLFSLHPSIWNSNFMHYKQDIDSGLYIRRDSEKKDVQ